MNVSHKSRRRRAGLMALCMLATCGAMLPENSVQQTVSADSFGLYGDLDGNGMVNAMDLQLLKSYVLSNTTSFPADDASFGDLTGDGQVNKADVQILQDYLMSRCNGFIQQGTVYDNIYFAKHAALELAATETTNAGSLTGTYVKRFDMYLWATQGFPSIGGCGGENSLMMAGSASKITDFDGWMLRYVWSKIKDESGRFS